MAARGTQFRILTQKLKGPRTVTKETRWGPTKGITPPGRKERTKGA
jgi:hypothetical protein